MAYCMKTIAEMKTQFTQRAGEYGLDIDCLMSGALAGEVAVIAEAPGPREVQGKMPLIGGTGQILWQGLRKYGLNRNNVYVTNVVKKQLAILGHKRSITAGDVTKWQQLLRWELMQLPNLKYILVLGDYALQAITGNKGVTNWRGSVIPTQMEVPELVDGQVTIGRRDIIVVVTYNPAYVIRSPQLEPVMHMDFHKLDRVMKGSFTPHEMNPIINPSPDEAIQWCDKMLDEKKPVAFDIEVISNETACVGFANDTHTGMAINFRDLQRNRWSEPDEAGVRRNIQRVLSGRDVRLVAQNGSFDSYYLWYKDKIRVARIWFDTMLAHHTLYSTLPHNLGFLTTQYTNHPYYKDEGKNWREGGNIDQFWNYNVKDCCLTLAAANAMEGELRNQGLEEFFHSHIMRLQPHLVRMTVGGVKIDVPLKDKIAEDMRVKVAELREEFRITTHELTDPDREVNPNSPAQLSVLLFRDLHLPGKGTKVDKTNRDFMVSHPRTPPRAKHLLRVLGDYKAEHKFLTTYAEMKIDPDSRIRCEYKQTGVQSAPGRLSSASVMWGSGTNLQNQPKRAYEMFIADSGYCFVYFDLAQAEARVVAWLAQITPWIEQFEKARIDGKYDAHRALASEMFDTPYDEVPTKDREADGTPTIRYIAKRCRHGLNYRMQAGKLAEVTGLTHTKATEAFNIYHSTTPELRQWWEATILEAKATRELYSPLGRRLKYLGRLDDQALDSIIAFRPQSTVGDKVAQVIYECEDDKNWPHDARMCLNIHDALIALAPIKKAKLCLSIMKRQAEMPIMINGMPLIIPADLKMSVPDERGYHRWSTLKDIYL